MSDLVNPYIAGSPVTGTEMFFGRQDVFAFVRQALTGRHRDNVLVLYGQRRTGKTSVLCQMSRYLDKRYCCVFIDLHGLALDGLEGFLWELANHIARILRRDYQLNVARPNRDEFKLDPRGYFENEFLNQVWSAIGDRHLLLMLDEAIRLEEQVQAGQLEPEIFEYLRHLMQHYEQLDFLFSLGSGLEQMEKEYAFLFSVGLYKKISFLDRDATTALITQPVKECYRVAPPALERILQITSGHPYYTQLLCHSLFTQWQERGGALIEVDDVNATLDEVVERGLANLKYVWDESSAGEKATIAGIAAAMGEHNRPVGLDEVGRLWARYEVVVPGGEKAKATESLIAREVIAPRGSNKYVFTVDLQRLWVYKYRRLEWVKEELAEAVRRWPPVAAPSLFSRPFGLLVDSPAAMVRSLAILPASLGILLTVYLLVLRPPDIFYFTAEPLSSTVGTSVVLSWSVNRAVSVTIDPYSGSEKLTAAAGQLTVEPVVTTRYTLTARNVMGSSSVRSILFEVRPTSSVPPVLPTVPAAVPTLSMLQPTLTPTPPTPTPIVGRIVYTAKDDPGTQQLFWMDPSGQNLHQLTSDAGDKHNASCSLDGQQVAFESNRTGTWLIYRMRLDLSGSMEQVTRGTGNDQIPTWLPDGRSIAFTRKRAQTQTIYQVSLSDFSEHQLTTGEGDWRMSYSPDGLRFVFASTRSGNNNLWLMNSDGTGLRQLTFGPKASQDPAWSPDGRWIVYLSDRDGSRLDLYRIAPSGGETLRLTADASDKSNPNWSPDSQRIVFASNRLNSTNIYTIPWNGGEWTQLAIGGNPAWCR